MDYYSQIEQDRWVCEMLNFKKGGTWVDIGCARPIHINNTYALETQLNWSGLSLDISQEYIDEWEGQRSIEGLICENALTIDYDKWFTDNGIPEVVDYLSMDLEPPTITLEALYRIPFDKYKFRYITYETDAYRDMGTQELSRDYLRSKGYVLIKEGDQDDFWGHGDASSLGTW
tara:strand:+ start:109 stop:630 length:522 start_codon:yes stop_codon:yes gene_type:complete